METSICRCCASEGAFKDVKSTYHWMGEEEIYADMLKECFDINLFQPEGAEDSGICEVCITQLRNAVNFKKQVLHTEEQFKKQLQSGKMFKPSIVKVEVPMEHHDSDDDDHASAEDGYSEPDFEIPIKIEDTEETEKRPKSKKRAAPVKKSTSTRAKKAKIEEGEPSTKRKRPINIKRTKITESTSKEDTDKIILSKNQQDIEELKKHHHNIKEVLMHTNATAIHRYTDMGFWCCFCASFYLNPAELKEHTIEVHGDQYNPAAARIKNRIKDYYIKLDITGLRCKLCSVAIDSLEELFNHLSKEHQRIIHTDIKNRIFPFKFDSESISCCICTIVYDKFKTLLEHMNTHYRNYICEICDLGFTIPKSLDCHSDKHKIGNFKCNFCTKTYDTVQKKRNHEKAVHDERYTKRFKCSYCNDRFSNYIKKDEHLAKVHGIQLKPVKCRSCDKVYSNKRALTTHTKRDHLLERNYKCTQCDKLFYSSHALKMHMLKHSGIKEFQCQVCSKSFARRSTLVEHLRIHDDVRRFKCEHCGQAFVQKCSWKGHMRHRHGEIV